MPSTLRPLALALGFACLAALGNAQFRLTEVFFNPVGTDQGQEGVEIQGAPHASLAGYFLLAIDGDATSAGALDVRHDLGAYTTGANGLLLIRDSIASPIQPAPASGTSVVEFDWIPDFENGSNTYVLGFGNPPLLGSDLDSNNDGALDAGALGGFTVVDAVAVIENDAGSNMGYADDLGFTTLGPFDGSTGPAAHTPDALYRLLDPEGAAIGWVGGDLMGVNPGGPYSFDAASNKVSGLFEAGLSSLGANLGSPNVAVSLRGSPLSISIAAGGTQVLSLAAGASKAGDLYFVLGSVSGTLPGIAIDSVVLPLNYDVYFGSTLGLKTALLASSLSALNGFGAGTCTFQMPAGTPVSGVPFTAHHAYVVLDLGQGVATFASNAIPLTLVP